MANHQKQAEQNGTNQAEVVVVMVPFVAQGHLNQLLHLSHLISSYNIPVHFACTPAHTRQSKLRVHGWDPFSTSNIHFHEFSTPPFLSPPPNPNSTIKFPSHLQPAFDASLKLREPITKLVLSLSSTARRVTVIHDSLMSYVVQDVVSIPNAEAYIFRSLSAICTFSFSWQRLDKDKAFRIEPELIKGLPSPEGSFSQEFSEFARLQRPPQAFQVGELYDTSRLIEGKYLELLQREEFCTASTKTKTKLWAVGPFNPIKIISNAMDFKNRHKCLHWLDKQPANSVIYVSFGTTTSFTDEQIKEMAIGLEKSEQKFIWVLRDADRGDEFSGGELRRIELPEGYEQGVESKGMVVRDWAPQMEILGHSATGGFMSHCGWNSSMESISMGVPMATWPMHSDQPTNAFLVTDVLRIGVVVKDWAKRDELVTSLMVEKAVRKLMDSIEGDEIRRRAAELGGDVRRSVEEGGVGRKELDSFIAYVCR